MITLSDKSFYKLFAALALYLASLFASNTLGLKVMPFLFDSHLSVAVFFFPFVFLMTDVIGEVYGKKIAKLFVYAGLLATVLFVLYSFLSMAMPWAARGAWVQESYDTVFGISVRIAIASIVAYFIAQYSDVLTFFFFKKKMSGKEVGKKIVSKLFWLRSLLSNVVSQFLDTAIFMVIAFAGVYDNDVLISLIITWWLYKVGMGFLYTPLSYAAIKILKDTDEGDGKDKKL